MSVSLGRLTLVIDDGVDVFEVTTDFVVVETESNDKVVRNLHSNVVDCKILSTRLRLEKKTADP